MKVIALIPARGGSRRIHRKNLERVGGITLVERAIAAAQVANLHAVYVSTDDDEIESVALSAGAFVLRSNVHGDSTPMEAVVRDFLTPQSYKLDDILVLLEPTAPLRISADIELIVALMVATGAPAARMVYGEQGRCHGWRYSDAGLASAIRVGSFTDCLFPRGTLLVHDGDERSVDVDTPEDLDRARALA